MYTHVCTRIDGDDVAGLDALLLDGLDHLLPEIVHRLLSGNNNYKDTNSNYNNNS